MTWPGVEMEAVVQTEVAGPRALLDAIACGALSRPVHLDLSGANLAGASLRGMDLSGWCLADAELSGADLTHADLTMADLRGATLHGACLDDAELRGAHLEGADLTRATARRAGLGRARLDDAHLFGADLTGSTLTDAVLDRADLRTAVLVDARAHGVRLREAHVEGANLRHADLTEADVARASFRGASLREVRLGGVHGYRTADWVRTDLRSADFTGAALLRSHAIDENYLAELRDQGWWGAAIYLVWKATSDCGRSAGLWGAWTALIAVVFGGIYTQVGIDYGPHPTPLSPLYFSIVTLTTLGFGDAVPATQGAQLAVMAEVILGYVMLGGSLSIFATRMARRAS